MSTKKPLGLGLVGIGRAGWGMHLPELASRQDKIQVVAACDIEAPRGQRAAERLNCRMYTKFQYLLADPDVEVVSIATRSPDHTPHALAALKAGKYVYLEKPIAITMEQARQLQRAATTGAGKGKLFIRHNRRHEPAFVHIREIIASGILGDVYEIKLHRHGFTRRDDWQALIGCGGGLLNNWGPHIVDHALQFLESPLAEVWSDLKRVAAVGDAEDHLHLILKGKNNRVVDMEISGGAAIAEPVYVVFGTRGALTSDEKNITLRYLDPKQKLQKRKASPSTPPQEGSFGSPETLNWVEKTIAVKPAGLAGMEILWDCLYDTIRNRKPFPIKLAEALEVVRVSCLVKKGTPFAPKTK